MIRITVIATLVMAAALVMSCAAGTTTPPAAISPPSKVSQSRAGWEIEWDKVAAEARKEARLLLLTSLGSDVRLEITKVMKEKFGIDAEFIAGRGTETAEKIAGERRAGLYLQDAYMGGVSTALTLLKPKGFLEVMDTALFLPEVVDPKVWWQGSLPYLDKDHTIMAYMAIAQQPITINTALVKPGEVTSWKDLLNPKFKGKIILDDPSVTGKGSTTVIVASEIMGMDYVRELGRQDIAITRDKRLHIEGIARGKYLIGLGVDDSVRTEFERAGAPVKNITPQEGTYLSASSGGLALINRPAHPNATRLLANWALGKEGQTMLSKAFGFQSARTDTPTEHLPTEDLRKPGIKYLNTLTEEFRMKEEEFRKVSKEIFWQTSN